MSKEVVLTAANFESEVLKSEIPVLVDFWAEWCMPCRMIVPSLEQMAEAHSGKLKIGKVNVDKEQELAEKYSVISIPTLMLFKGGEAVKNHIGAAPRQTLEDLVKSYL